MDQTPKVRTYKISFDTMDIKKQFILIIQEFSARNIEINNKVEILEQNYDFFVDFIKKNFVS